METTTNLYRGIDMAAKTIHRSKVCKHYNIYLVKNGKPELIAYRVPASLKAQVLSEIPRSFAR